MANTFNTKDLVENFLEYYLKIKRCSEHTVLSYSTDLKSFDKYCREEYDIDDIQKVTHLVMRSWVVSMKSAGVANTSINRKISALKSFYKYLLRKQIVTINPTAKVQALKKSKRLPSFVPERKMDYLVEQQIGKRTFSNWRDDLIIELLYATGMRRSELINLTFSDINEARLELKVLGKGNKERICPLTTALIAKINDFRVGLFEEFGALDHQFIIVTNKGKKAYPKLIFNIVTRRLKSINAAEKTSPHVLRHTFATHLSSNGAELNAIKELLGHSSLAATQVYTHNSIERLKKEYMKAHPLGE